jgi:hypothetical protein
MICGLEKIDGQQSDTVHERENTFLFKAPEGVCLITEELARSIEEQQARGWMPVIRHFCTELRGANPGEMICVDCGRIWRITLSTK